MKKFLLTAILVTLASPALACEGFENSMKALEEAVGVPQTTTARPAPQPAPSPPPAIPPAAPGRK